MRDRRPSILLRLIPAALALLACAGAQLCAQPVGGPQNLDPRDDHVIIIPPSIDFGCVIFGNTASRTFRVINPNDRDSAIVRGFRVPPGFSVRPGIFRRIAPGDTLVDTIYFRPLEPRIDYGGKFEIDFERGGPGEIDVTGSGSIAPRIFMVIDSGNVITDSLKIFRLGSIIVGDTTPVRCVRLFNPSCKPAFITKITHTASKAVLYSPALPASDTIGPHQEQVMCIRFAPDTFGSLADTITMTFADKHTEQIVFGGVGVLRATIVAHPGKLLFDSVAVGQISVADTAWLLNTGGTPTQVLSLELVGTDAADYVITTPKLPLDKPAGLRGNGQDSLMVVVRFSPLESGTHVASLRVVHNRPDEDPVFPLVLEGRVPVAAPRVTPRQLNFGRVQIGDTATFTDTLVLTNAGDAVLPFAPPRIEGPDSARFSVQSRPATVLGARESLSYTVSFHPDSARLFDRALIVVTFGGGPTFRVPLTGQGIRPSRDEVRIVPNPIRFTCVPAGDTAYTRVRVYNNSADSVTLKDLVIANQRQREFPFVVPPVAAGSGIGAHDSVDFTIGFIPGSAPTYSDMLRLDFDPEGNVEAPISGDAVTVPALDADASEVIFPAADSGGSAKQMVTLTNPSPCLPLVIRSIDIDDTAFARLSGLKVGDTLPSGDAGPLRLLYTSYDTLVHHATLVITSAYKSYETRRAIALTAKGTGDDVPAVAVSQVTFDSTTVGASSIRTFVLTNTGDADDTLDAGTVRVLGGKPGDFTVQQTGGSSVLHAHGIDGATFEVTFAPKDSGARAAQIEIDHHWTRKRSGTYSIPVSGPGRLVEIVMSGTLLDLGDVPVGDTLTRPAAFSFRNADATVSATLQSLTPGNSPGGQIATAGPLSIAIAPGQSVAYDVVFHPTRLGPDTLHATATFSTGLTVPVTISGRGVARAGRTVWLDTVDAVVGQPLTLRLRVAPPLAPADNVTAGTAKLIVSPLALYVQHLRVLGKDQPVYFIKPDTIVVAWSGTDAATGSELATLTMTGLVTGQTLNSVHVAGAELSGLGPVSDLHDGLVRLSGCDIGSNPFGKPIVARRMYPSPASEAFTVTYFAPLDSHPVIEIINLAGTIVRTEELPVGMGAETEHTTQLAGLGSGMYFVQLRAGAVRSVGSIVVTK